MKASRKPSTTELNMTPMIDIVFLLITFFMVVSELSYQEQVDIEAPRTRHNDTLDAGYLIVTVLADGTYSVGGERVGIDRLEHILVVEARTNPHRKLLIRADRRAAYRHIRALLKLCTQRDIATDRVAFYTKPTAS